MGPKAQEGKSAGLTFPFHDSDAVPPPYTFLSFYVLHFYHFFLLIYYFFVRSQEFDSVYILLQLLLERGRKRERFSKRFWYFFSSVCTVSFVKESCRKGFCTLLTVKYFVKFSVLKWASFFFFYVTIRILERFQFVFVDLEKLVFCFWWWLLGIFPFIVLVNIGIYELCRWNFYKLCFELMFGFSSEGFPFSTVFFSPIFDF